jgi:hypothetical protein
MSRKTPPQFVELFNVGQPLKSTPIGHCSFESAKQLVANRRAQWRDHRRKLVIFPAPDHSRGGVERAHAGTPGCKFPAAALRAYRAALREEITQREAAGESMSPSIIALLNITLHLERMRSAHAEFQNCDCWHTPQEMAEWGKKQREAAEHAARIRAANDKFGRMSGGK